MASDNIRKEVLVSVKLDTSNLESEQKKIASRLIDVKDQVSNLNKELKKTSGDKERQKLKDQLFELQAEAKKLTTRQREVNKELETNAKIVNSNIGSNNQLRALLSKLTAELNAMGESEKQTSEKGKQLAASVLEITNQLKENESAVGDNRRNVGNYTKIELAELIEALKKENQGLEQVQKTTQDNIKKGIGFNTVTKDGTVQTKGFTNALQGTNNALQTNEDAYEQATTAIHNNNEEIANLERRMIGFKVKIDEGGESVVEYENNLTGLKLKLSDLQKTLSTQTIGSEAFNKTNESIKKTSFEIQKVQGNVDEFGNKEPKNLVKKSYDDLADSAAGVAGAIQLTEIAFGKSNSTAEAQARILKLVAVQQAVVNVAKGIGATKDLLQTVAVKLLNKETGLLTQAQKLYTSALGKSTGAARLFKGALISTGIGAIIALIGELVFNFDGVTKVVNQAVNKIRDFAAGVSNGNKAVKFLVEILLLVGSPLVTIIRLIADFEGTVKSFQNAFTEFGDSIVSATQNIPILGSVIKAMVANAQAMIKVFNNVATSLGLMGKKKFKTDIEQLTKFYDSFKYSVEQSQVALKNQIALLQASGNKSQQVSKLQRELLKQNIDAELEAFAVAQEIAKKVIQQESKLNDEQQKLFDERANAVKTAQNDLAIFEEQELQKSIERAKTRNQVILDLTNELKRLQISLVKDEFDRRKQEIEQSLVEEREASAQRIKDLKEDGINTVKIKEQEKEKIKLLEEIAFHDLENIEQDRLKGLEALAEEAEEIKKDQLEHDLQAQLEKLEKEFVLEEQFAGLTTMSLATNEKERRAEQVKNELDRLQAARNFYAEALKLTKAFAATDGFIDEEEKKKIEELALALNAVDKEMAAIQKKAESGLIPKDFADKFQEGVNVALSLLGSFTDAVNASYASQQAAIDATNKKQIRAIEGSTLTTLQKNEQIAKAELDAQKKKYALEVEAFNFNKGIKIAEAAIGIAAGVVNAFATAPFPLSIVQAALATITGGIQIGIIASQQPPPPPFYEGGYTGQGNPRQVSTRLGKKPYTYHADEYVVPSKVLRTRHGSSLVGKLEEMRMNKVGSLGMAGMADGGFSSSQMRSEVMNSMDIEALSNKLLNGIEGIQPVVLVSDINRVNNNLKKAQVKSSL